MAPSVNSDDLTVAPPASVERGATFVIAAAGDIAGRGNAHAQTGELLLRLIETKRVAAVLLAGDLAYPNGTYEDFLAYFDPSWGKLPIRAITRPVPGNHEYALGRSDAQGYFDYFNGAGRASGPAGERGHGYYSFDLGDWHFIAINTSDGCTKIPCTPSSPMHAWLVRDLEKNQRRCTLAYFHHPRFQYGLHGHTKSVAPIWNALFRAGVDVALNGHDHNYQQLGPMDANGRRDRDHGIRTFVVGTGGAKPYQFAEGPPPEALEAKTYGRFGVLLMTLGPSGYRWEFVATTRDGNGDVLVSGEDVCR